MPFLSLSLFPSRQLGSPRVIQASERASIKEGRVSITKRRWCIGKCRLWKGRVGADFGLFNLPLSRQMMKKVLFGGGGEYEADIYFLLLLEGNHSEEASIVELKPLFVPSSPLGGSFALESFESVTLAFMQMMSSLFFSFEQSIDRSIHRFLRFISEKEEICKSRPIDISVSRDYSKGNGSGRGGGGGGGGVGEGGGE
jgi:uncharacterized membrane protein YgcG